MPSRKNSARSDEFVLVYGTHGIHLDYGTKADMNAGAARLNKQAPQYNHRVVPRADAFKLKRKG